MLYKLLAQALIQPNRRPPAPKEIFWIKGDLERFDGYNYLGDRPESMIEFLNKYMDS